MSNNQKTLLKIRTIKRDDIRAFNDGETYSKSLRGLTVERDDGKIMAIAGVLHTNPPQVFSQMDEDMHNYPVTIMKTAKQLLRILNLYEVTLYAWASEDEPTSESFLQHLGFEFSGVNADGRFYQWQKQ